MCVFVSSQWVRSYFSLADSLWRHSLMSWLLEAERTHTSFIFAGTQTRQYRKHLDLFIYKNHSLSCSLRWLQSPLCQKKVQVSNEVYQQKILQINAIVLLFTSSLQVHRAAFNGGSWSNHKIHLLVQCERCMESFATSYFHFLTKDEYSGLDFHIHAFPFFLPCINSITTTLGKVGVVCLGGVANAS